MSVIGFYECYAGHQQVPNPALKRQIRFIQGYQKTMHAMCFGVESGGADAAWKLHNVIPLSEILVEELSLSQQQQLIAQHCDTGKTLDIDTICARSLFSDLSPKRQEEIAAEIGNPLKWSVSVTWKRGPDGFVATADRVDEVASLLLQPMDPSE